MALAKPERRRRMPNIFKLLQDDGDTKRGQIVSFLHIQEKLWTMWIECVPNESLDKCIKKREGQGFRKVESVPIPEVIPENRPFRRQSRQSNKQKVDQQKPKRDDVDLIEGMLFQLDLNGEITMCSDDASGSYKQIHYHSKLDENYRRFFVQPIQPDEEGKYKSLNSVLNVNIVDKNGENTQCVKSFRLEVSEQEVTDFFYEPPPTPEPEPEPEPEQEPEPVVETEAPTPKISTSRLPSASFLRLITPMKPPRKSKDLLCVFCVQFYFPGL